VAITYDTARTFATEAGVFREAAITLTSATVPLDTDAEQWAYSIGALVVLATQKAGSRMTPPTSGVSDTFLGEMLQTATEVGAAACVRWAIYARTKSKLDLEVWEQLRDRWAEYFGSDAVSGAGALGAGTGGGSIGALIAAQSGSNVLSSDVTVGQITMESLPVRQDESHRFRMTDAE
jgi:hypothetical protein